MRYIASFESAFYRALNKLEKLQKERRAAERQAAIEGAALQVVSAAAADKVAHSQPVDAPQHDSRLRFAQPHQASASVGH